MLTLKNQIENTKSKTKILKIVSFITKETNNSEISTKKDEPLYKNGKPKFYQRLLPKNKIKILNL